MLNFLLYRLGYDKKLNIHSSLDEEYLEKVEKGYFYLAQRLFPPVGADNVSGEEAAADFDSLEERSPKEKLGGYVFSLIYAFVAPISGRDKLLKVHLPHLHIHRRVRDSLANLGLTIG